MPNLNGKQQVTFKGVTTDSPVRLRSSPTLAASTSPPPNGNGSSGGPESQPLVKSTSNSGSSSAPSSLPVFHIGQESSSTLDGMEMPKPNSSRSSSSTRFSSTMRKYGTQPRMIIPFLLIVLPIYGLLYHLPFKLEDYNVLSTNLGGSSSSSTTDPTHPNYTYKPGKLGSKLLSKYSKYAESDPPKPSDLFSLSAHRDSLPCTGWSPTAQAQKEEEDLLIRSYDDLNNREAERDGKGSLLGRGDGQDRRKNRFLRVREMGGEWEKCWKARMWNQIQDWEWTKPFSQLPEMQERNSQALERLSRCLASETDLPEYPSDPNAFYDTDISPSSLNTTLPGRDFFDRSTPWISTIPCSQTSTKVVLGLWWYFSLAFTAEKGATSGEAVWMRSQLAALYAQGYTVLAVNDYEAVTEIHRAMPDVISHIWAEERYVLTCQDDPRCIDYSTFEPTEDKYDLELTLEGEPEIWNQRKPLPQDRGKRKWIWGQAELDAIPLNERGTIPLYKLFTTTYWGARPHDNFWQINEREFWWNPLGQEWTLSPFDYPDHTYIPFSIEKACTRAPFFPPEEREDRLFVLAKRTTYFQDWSSSIAQGFWATLSEKTGLRALSVAIDDQKKEGEDPIDLPKGVETIGKVTMDEFEKVMGKSKLMLGIGRPGISPSVYSALCQGTPVVLPYYKGVAIPTGWDLFDGSFTQHGPAAAIGPPYVYSYDKNNETMLVEIIKEAAMTPIDRYIPEDMSHASQLKNMDDLMRFDWKRHAALISRTRNVQGEVFEGEEITEDFELRRTVLSWCHETGRCQPVVWEI